jgi:hypothetical protein
MRQLTVLTALALSLAALPAQAQVCNGAPVTVNLVTTSGATAGTVTVSNDASFLYVTFLTIPDWTMSQLDVAVAASLGGIPQSSGAPDPSAFPYRTQFSPGVNSYTFTIPLGGFQIGTQLFVAAHASLQSPTQGKKDAWGAGTRFPGSKDCGSCDGKDGEHHDESCGGDDHHDCDHHDGGDSHSEGDHHDGSSYGGSTSGDSHNASGRGGDSSHGDDHGDGHHDDDHHGDDHHGDDHHDDEGGGACGATYFTYVLNCLNPE